MNFHPPLPGSSPFAAPLDLERKMLWPQLNTLIMVYMGQTVRDIYFEKKISFACTCTRSWIEAINISNVSPLNHSVCSGSRPKEDLQDCFDLRRSSASLKN